MLERCNHSFVSKTLRIWAVTPNLIRSPSQFRKLGREGALGQHEGSARSSNNANTGEPLDLFQFFPDVGSSFRSRNVA